MLKWSGLSHLQLSTEGTHPAYLKHTIVNCHIERLDYLQGSPIETVTVSTMDDIHHFIIRIL